MPDRNVHVSDHSTYKDIRFGAVAKFLYWLFAMVIVSYFAMYGVYVMFDSSIKASDPAPPPTAEVEFTAPPVSIQPAPHYDLVEYEEKLDQASEAAIQSGATISIEDAIDATLSEGLPYREEAPVAVTTPEEVESSNDSQE